MFAYVLVLEPSCKKMTLKPGAQVSISTQSYDKVAWIERKYSVVKHCKKKWNHIRDGFLYTGILLYNFTFFSILHDLNQI